MLNSFYNTVLCDKKRVSLFNVLFQSASLPYTHTALQVEVLSLLLCLDPIQGQ